MGEFLMAGYQTNFLDIEVALPTVEGSTILPNQNFTTVFNRERKLAFFSALNYQHPFNLGGDGRFHRDGRVGDDQVENNLYRNNAWDRGHLAARRFVDWGDNADAGDRDSFLWTNIVPMHKNMHTSAGREWSAMEDHLENIAANNAKDRKMTMFVGCIFLDDDLTLNANDGSNLVVDDDGVTDNDEVKVPQFFWAIGVWVNRFSNRLNSVGFLIENYRPDLTGNGGPIDYNLTDSFSTTADRVPVRDISLWTGINLDDGVIEADIFRVPSVPRN